MSERTPEQHASDDLLITHLRAAIRLGYTMATPGANDAVRAAFPELFATETEVDGVDATDDLELDDHPMVSRGDRGSWVQTWSWVMSPDTEED